jgi:DNA repair protein RecO (recombination protein O)
MNKLPVYKTEGIILKAADLGELDRLLTVYTRGYGKILARAISARKRESKLRGLLEPFTCGNFLLAKSKTIDIMTDVETIDNYSFLHNNLENLSYAFYFAELTDRLIPAPERDENIWRLIGRVFEVLNQEGGDLPKIRAAFEDKLLEFLGHPTMAGCGKISSLQKLDYLQSLAGENFNSCKFLAQAANKI